ncbi:MAG: thioesterase family protein [Polaribacter sp.]|jgi:acyl-CoA thioester hydrolase|nr:thioesterase family protein [Polaribacter sp.]MDG1953712.1 thioesterase family protein [Polaribacter sp.]
MTKESNIFISHHIVKSDEIDDLNHVNNAVYVKWMDNVAYLHWQKLTENHPLPDYIWVVSRHEIDYKRQAVLGDEIEIKTWVGETSGIKSIRHIEFYKDQKLLVKSKTFWVLLNAKTYKPTRITENVLKVLEASK